MDRFTGFIGIFLILGIAVAFSTNRRAIQPRILLWGLGLQFSFAFLVLKTDFGKLFQLASELKEESEKTDSAKVLSVAMVRKAEEIERLAKDIKSRAKG